MKTLKSPNAKSRATFKLAQEAGLFKYTKWEEYFKLQPRDYFGGRVLFNHQIEAREASDAQEAGA